MSVLWLAAIVALASITGSLVTIAVQRVLQAHYGEPLITGHKFVLLSWRSGRCGYLAHPRAERCGVIRRYHQT